MADKPLIQVAEGIDIPATPGSDDQSYPINTGKIFLFDVLTDRGERNFVLGLPIAFSTAEAPRERILHISDVVAGRPSTIIVRHICGLFPATVEGSLFVECCQAGMPILDIYNTFTAYVAVAPNARDMPVLQFAKLQDLEQLFSKLNWVKNETPPNVKPEQYEVVAACADTLIRHAAEIQGPDRHIDRTFLRGAAIELMRVAPTVQQRWLDAEAAGAELRTLRGEVRNLKNELTAAKEENVQLLRKYVAGSDGGPGTK